MAQVIALADYQEQFREPELPLRTNLPRPKIRGEDVWCRKYDTLESVVFGLLKVREIVNYYAGFDVKRDNMFMEILEAVYHFNPKSPQGLLEVIKPAKDYILENTPAEDRKHMLLAIVMLDLIEKSCVSQN